MVSAFNLRISDIFIETHHSVRRAQAAPLLCRMSREIGQFRVRKSRMGFVCEEVNSSLAGLARDKGEDIT